MLRKQFKEYLTVRVLKIVSEQGERESGELLRLAAQLKS